VYYLRIKPEFDIGIEKIRMGTTSKLIEINDKFPSLLQKDTVAHMLLQAWKGKWLHRDT
jgi:hypothetical protein